MYLVDAPPPSSSSQGICRAAGQTLCVCTRPPVPGETLYRTHRQSPNTHRGKHRSGGAQHKDLRTIRKCLSQHFSKSFSLPKMCTKMFLLPRSFAGVATLIVWCFWIWSRTKNQPKEEVLGTDIPRTSGGRSRGYPGPKLRSGRPKSWQNKHLGADVHDPKARTSTTLRDFQKLRSEKLWAEFSFPNYHIT